MAQTKLMNAKVIEQIIRDTSVDILDPLLSAFLSELNEHQVLLTTAFKAQSITQIASEAHALKSCSGTFGAQALYMHSMALEDKAKLTDINIELLSSNVNQVLDTLKATQQYYQAYDFSEIKSIVNT